MERSAAQRMRCARGRALEGEQRHADAEQRGHVIHLRAGHEHHERREREQHRCQQRNTRSLGFDAARERGEAPHRERAAQRDGDPGRAEPHARGEDRGPTGGKLRKDTPIPLNEMQGAEQLGHGVQNACDASAGEDASLEELRDFVDQQWTTIEHPLRRQRVQGKGRDDEQCGRQSRASRPELHHRIERSGTPEPLRAT